MSLLAMEYLVLEKKRKNIILEWLCIREGERMTEKALDFSDLLNYLDDYIEFYGLNHSEKLLVRNYCDFIYRRHKKILKIGKEVEE